MEADMDLGERLKTRRAELKLSQKQLALSLGVTQGAVAQFESGARSPSLELLARLADRLRVSTDYLIRGEEPGHVDVSPLNAGDRRLVKRLAEYLLWERKKA
jgi:transcriptional regulator with XRE-family HTH domain